MCHVWMVSEIRGVRVFSCRLFCSAAPPLSEYGLVRSVARKFSFLLFLIAWEDIVGKMSKESLIGRETETGWGEWDWNEDDGWEKIGNEGGDKERKNTDGLKQRRSLMAEMIREVFRKTLRFIIFTCCEIKSGPFQISV